MTIGASKSAAASDRRIRLGMVGGGEGAFIGAVHRIAARLDDHYELVAGALASTPAKAKRSGRALGLVDERVYGDYAAMAKAEGARADGIEAVAIVTPNHLHVPVAEAFLKAGIHVICDKPLATSVRDARRLQVLAAKHDRLFAVTYNYTGYPMVRQARQMVEDGLLGAIRVIQVEYAQDWLTEPLEATGQKQAEWRTDPARRARAAASATSARMPISSPATSPAWPVDRALRRAEHLRCWAQARRQRPGDAALRQRRARRALGEPGRSRQREQPAPARVRQPRRHRVAPGAAEPARLLAFRPTDEDDLALG